MKNDKGFTLIELLAVLILIVAIVLIALPPIVEKIRETKNDVGDTTLEIIGNATDLYLDANIDKYPKTNGQIYYITIQELVNDQLLSEPVIDVTTGNEIPLTRQIKITVIDEKYQHELII